MNKNKYIFYLLLSLCLISGGCVNENLDDCPQDILLEFNVLMAKYEFQEIVDDVTVYLFDEDNNYYNKYYYTNDALKQNAYKAVVPRPSIKGKYTFVVLVNHSEDFYETFGYEKRDEMRTRLKTNPEDYSINKKQVDLYHGYKEIEIIDVTNTVSYLVDLTKDTNNIDLSVTIQDSSTENSDEISTNMIGTNDTYNYSNESVGNTPITYYAHTRDGVSSTRSDDIAFDENYRTMRLFVNSDLKINFYKKIEEQEKLKVSEVNLSQILTSIKDPSGNYLYNTNDKLWAEDEFDVHITLDGTTYTIVKLVVNDWTAIDIDDPL